MSITSDLKSYVDQTVATAQAQLNDVAGTATKYRDDFADVANKANDAVNDLRASAEKAINLEAIRTAVEPYLAQVREYGTAVTDRAEDLFNGVVDDPRLAKLVETANTVSSVVLEQVSEYVVKPVQSFTGFGAKPAARPAPKPSKPATTKPANTKPATSRPAAKSTAKKTTAKVGTAKTTTAKSPRKSTARKSTATS
ncbi:hypothetical protein [Jatrophihabitans endophyticus]|uniref:hypothetical protein n=1 Tax=Jatrophihabitans endophyticus TaxID=1206085 RepID=UPI001A0205EC|nr:hypothetical protein [Jatrophihabitans endophyticus]MBE7189132.1 hypothetical protein [Jatrophihabitans endophyticus]